MPTAYSYPCCPNRVATSRSIRWQTLLAFGLVWTTTATASVTGKETDSRIFNPASRVQPRDVEDADVTNTVHLAAKWSNNLSLLQKEKKAATESKLPSPGKDELLVVPQPTTSNDSEEEDTEQRTCYRAPALASISTSIALPDGKLPTDAAAECAARTQPIGDARLACAWAITEQHWAPTCLCHRPLYFEEINAERYGYTPSYLFQPLISAGHFFMTIPILPYKMAVECPRDCIYTLGHYRPGSCVPWRGNRLPFKLKGIAVETGFIAGLILLIP